VAGQTTLAMENALAHQEITHLKNKLAEEKLYLQEEVRTERGFEEIIGDSQALKHVLDQITIVAPTDSTIKADITKRPGFISGKFYRSLKPDSRYNFINVAIWENEELYWKAFEQSITHEKLKQLTAEMTPALYNVAVEY
jgi:hypothetical protein